jgi:hypothetical protein
MLCDGRHTHRSKIACDGRHTPVTVVTLTESKFWGFCFVTTQELCWCKTMSISNELFIKKFGQGRCPLDPRPCWSMLLVCVYISNTHLCYPFSYLFMLISTLVRVVKPFLMLDCFGIHHSSVWTSNFSLNLLLRSSHYLLCENPQRTLCPRVPVTFCTRISSPIFLLTFGKEFSLPSIEEIRPFFFLTFCLEGPFSCATVSLLPIMQENHIS